MIDDPLKAEEAMSELARKRVIDWYAGTLVSRLNDKQCGPIVVVMQRLHENDLAGHLLGKVVGNTSICRPLHSTTA